MTIQEKFSMKVKELKLSEKDFLYITGILNVLSTNAFMYFFKTFTKK